MLITQNLTKTYLDKTVVNNLNIHIVPGEIYGFLGPNGAGKSTTINMVLGITQPTGGSVRLFGKSLADDYIAIKRRIGVVGEIQHYYDEMTGYEYLTFFAGLFGVRPRRNQIMDLLDRLGLSYCHQLPLRAYSKGMQQKMGLARALIHNPELLILDEPVSSLDPQGIKQVREIILEENQKGKTILISSHLLSEIEKTCHRIGIMNHGEMLVEDTIAGIRAKLLSGSEIQVEIEDCPDGIIQELKALPFVTYVSVNENTLLISTDNQRDYRGEIIKYLVDKGCSVMNIVQNQMTLEEAFVTITENNIAL